MVCDSISSEAFNSADHHCQSADEHHKLDGVMIFVESSLPTGSDSESRACQIFRIAPISSILAKKALLFTGKRVQNLVDAVCTNGIFRLELMGRTFSSSAYTYHVPRGYQALPGDWANDMEVSVYS